MRPGAWWRSKKSTFDTSPLIIIIQAMLHRLALRIQQHFCIDWSQLKRTKWAKLTDRSLLVLQGPDTHKYNFSHKGCFRAWWPMTCASWARRKKMETVIRESHYSLCFCNRREKFWQMPSSSNPEYTKMGRRNTPKKSSGSTSIKAPNQH